MRRSAGQTGESAAENSDKRPGSRRNAAVGGADATAIAACRRYADDRLMSFSGGGVDARRCTPNHRRIDCSTVARWSRRVRRPVSRLPRSARHQPELHAVARAQTGTVMRRDRAGTPGDAKRRSSNMVASPSGVRVQPARGRPRPPGSYLVGQNRRPAPIATPVDHRPRHALGSGYRRCG